MDDHHPHDCTECISSALDLFKKPQVQLGFEDKRLRVDSPRHAFDLEQPLTFDISVGSDEYLDTTSLQLFLKLKIVDQANANLGAAPAAGANAGVLPDRSICFPINNIASTLFKELNVKIHSKLVSKSSNLYAYRCLIEKLLSYSPSVLTSTAERSGFYLDDADVHQYGPDIKNDDYKANTGAKARFNLSVPSKVFQVCDRLHADICSSDTFLPPNTKLNLELIRNNNKFCLMGHTEAAGYKIKILDAYLESRVFKIANSVKESHQLSLQHNPYMFMFRQVELRYHNFQAQSTNLNLVDFYTHNTTPRRVIFGLVAADGFLGNFHMNPAGFENYKVTQFVLRNDDKIVDRELNADYANDLFIEPYNNFLSGSGVLDEANRGTIITKEIFKNSCNLYCFDLTSFHSAEQDVLDPNKSCKLSVEIKLGEPLPRNVVLICYLENDSFIKITKDKEVLFPKE